ncbi:tetratricopeptide repeat protein [Paenibacillus albiflavus]|uniref:tetratricopeptide repeat protein n=1 Tax=Paenibacillus albiflavus TaxID=2545760 RepID=UPI001F225058|nr:tetratricopeptide repeat protein [Paenibacillus albiflavus]
MFKHLFETMNEVLDEVSKEYPHASKAQRTKLDEQLQVLKTMSDEFIENWLAFEEKLRIFYMTNPQTDPAQVHVTKSKPPKGTTVLTNSYEGYNVQSMDFDRGQGYYKLSMFDEAIHQFETVVKGNPDCMLARAYLAMGHMRKGDHQEAARHFQFLIPLTDNAKIKAISYNVMGCIQYEKRNMDKAVEYFTKAYHCDPSVMNLDE